MDKLNIIYELCSDVKKIQTASWNFLNDKELCEQIVYLDCRWNNLTELPKDIGNLTNLEYFNCSNNQLTELPKDIGNLTNLKIIECDFNKLTHLPKEFCNLINLEYLYCSDNNLTELPKELGNLTNLKTLHCYSNNLNKLPKDIGNLKNITSIHCSYNKLTKLPKELSKLQNLKWFYCHYNPELPQEIGKIELKDYFKNLDYLKAYLIIEKVKKTLEEQRRKNAIKKIANYFSANVFMIPDSKFPFTVKKDLRESGYTEEEIEEYFKKIKNKKIKKLKSKSIKINK